jgi:hypothetical protein
MESNAIVSRKSTWPMRCSTCTQEAQLFSIVRMGHWAGECDFSYHSAWSGPWQHGEHFHKLQTTWSLEVKEVIWHFIISSCSHLPPFPLLIHHPLSKIPLGDRVENSSFWIFCSLSVPNGFPCVTKSARGYLASSLGDLVLRPLGLGARR